MPKKVLHYGMGFDSSAYLVSQIYAQSPPEVVLIAQTGSESILIKNQIETYIFPLLRAAKIRTVQIARASNRLKDGYLVLDDSYSPKTCYIRPDYERPYFTLSEDMLTSGTVPQFVRGKRFCSQKFKASILDSWHEKNCPGCYKIIGFNSDESTRIERAKKYPESPLHPTIYPLHEQGWSRGLIEAFIRWHFGLKFYRSACIYCPFSQISGGASEVRERYQLQPSEAAESAYLEYVSLCFNPKQVLSASEKSLTKRGLLSEEATELFLQMLESATWKIYRVKRIRGLACPYRSVKVIYVGDRFSVSQKFNQLVKNLDVRYCHHGVARGFVPSPPNCEEFIVAAPGEAVEKERASFSRRWEERKYQQLEIF